jgi:hypothetical protein
MLLGQPPLLDIQRHRPLAFFDNGVLQVNEVVVAAPGEYQAQAVQFLCVAVWVTHCVQI